MHCKYSTSLLDHHKQPKPNLFESLITISCKWLLNGKISITHLSPLISVCPRPFLSAPSWPLPLLVRYTSSIGLISWPKQYVFYMLKCNMYRVLIKYCAFPLNVVIFLNSASSAAVLVFDLSLCTHTDTEGKPREARVRNIFQKTQYLMNTLYI